jgi:hypothetical protein
MLVFVEDAAKSVLSADIKTGRGSRCGDRRPGPGSATAASRTATAGTPSSAWLLTQSWNRLPGSTATTPCSSWTRLGDFASEDDLVFAKDREIRRVHELIIQGYYDAGYRPVFVPADEPGRRVAFMLAQLPVPAT